jgi:hypothetical protein
LISTSPAPRQPVACLGRRALGAPLLAAPLAALPGTSAGCYEATSLRLTVQTPPTTLDCASTVDSVFFDAAYVRSNSVAGPNLFYTPRMTPHATRWGLVTPDLGWGIGVWLKPGPTNQGPPGGSACGFELEALSPDPGPGISHLYSAQRGEPFDRTLRDMAQRLTAAFDGARPPG